MILRGESQRRGHIENTDREEIWTEPRARA